MSQQVNKAVVEVQTLSLSKQRAVASGICLQSLDGQKMIRWSYSFGLYVLRNILLQTFGWQFITATSVWFSRRQILRAMLSNLTELTELRPAIMGEKKQLMIHVLSTSADVRLF